MKNEMTLTFSAVSDNVGLARNAGGGFWVGLEPTIEQPTEKNTAVSEAVTNSIVHAYPNGAGDKFVTVRTTIEDNTVHIVVSDEGVGIDDVDKAMQPFYTTKPEQERSGMGFTVMESFMDELSVERNTPTGTVIKMSKSLRGADWKKKKSSN